MSPSVLSFHARATRPVAVVSVLFGVSLAFLGPTACGNTSIGTGTGDGTAAAGGDSGTGGAASIRGLGCGVEAETGFVLCAGVSACPGLLVNQDAYPGCGFRVNGTAFDLQCACNDVLCPIGTPRTCSQAKALLDNQNRLIVCAQVNEGRCISGTKAASPSASSNPNTRGCDAQCMADCARSGVGSCEFLCGC